MRSVQRSGDELGAFGVVVPLPWQRRLRAGQRMPPSIGDLKSIRAFGVRGHADRSVPAAGTDSVDHHAVNAVVYGGWKMFEVYCTRCHGEDAVGSSFAPALIKSVGPGGADQPPRVLRDSNPWASGQGHADLGESPVAGAKGGYLELSACARRRRTRAGQAAHQTGRQSRFHRAAQGRRRGHDLARSARQLVDDGT